MLNIKFRVWDKEKSKMTYNPMIMDGKPYMYWIEWEDETLKYSRIYGDLMQCRGLKDKNDKDIYDGDIFQNDKATYKVVYHESLGIYCCEVVKTETCLCKGLRFPIVHYLNDECIFKHQIIGNCYENPELMKEGGIEV